uniref:Jupiter microtubule associated homolog 2 n=2 Tax=Amphiprion ocellaris TaxID=80972 RepID=A0A3Q1B967_AMPOC
MCKGSHLDVAYYMAKTAIASALLYTMKSCILSDYIVLLLCKGPPSVVNRAHPLGSRPVSSRGVTAGWTQILHYGVWLGTRTQAGGTCWTSSWQTDEVVFGNLKAQNKTTMTSTNMFQGLDSASKPSSRVLQPPGGGSSNVFGGYEDDSAAMRRPNKMASKVFAAPEEPQSVPKRSNPPGGKSSGIFGEPEAPAQPRRPVPPGGPTSNIFGAAESASVQSPSRSHPNKPKDNLSVGPEPESPAPEPKVSLPEVKEEPAPPAPAPAKEEPAPVSAPPAPAAPAAPAAPEPTSTSTPDDALLKNHEPRLGPKPRSHNRVLNPPGGKSSVVFY